MTDLEIAVKQIVYQCREKGNPVADTLAAYMAETTIHPGIPLFLSIRYKRILF